MTQPPENPGGQDGGSPPTIPPPGSWYFPDPGQQYVPPPPPPGAPSPYGAAPPPYGSAQQPYAPPPGQPYAPPPGQPYGGPPPGQPYAPPPGQPYGAPPPYGAPHPYGLSQSPYGPAHPGYAAPPGYRAGPEPDLAEWWRRLVARIIDGLVLSIVLAPLSFLMLRRAWERLVQVSNQYPDPSAPGAQSALSRADGRFFGAFLLIGVVFAVILFLYDWSQHARWGQTLGKRAMGTRVVTAYGRSAIGAAAAARRSAVYALAPAVPLIGGLFGLLNELWLLWDPRRQCLHDKAAGTIVIKTGPPAAGAAPQPPPW